MNIRTSDASNNRNGSSATWSRRTLGLTVAILSVLATAKAGLADNTASASLSVYGEAACTTATCSEAQITVTLEADCTSNPCTVTPSVENTQDCGLFGAFPAGFSSLVLYNNPTDTCTGTGTEAPYPVDLLAGPFALSLTQWHNVFVLDHLVVATAASGTATASGKTGKATSGIPTLSEWGVVIMMGFFLTAGTVVFRRSRRPHPNAHAG